MISEACSQQEKRKRLEEDEERSDVPCKSRKTDLDEGNQEESVGETICPKRDRNVDSEIQTLKSLIPGLSEEKQIGELELIDACVHYIESLERQLGEHGNNNSSSNSISDLDPNFNPGFNSDSCQEEKENLIIPEERIEDEPNLGSISTAQQDVKARRSSLQQRLA